MIAFRRLTSAGKARDNIIGFYGGFVKNGTYNVLLEYADEGSLERYFQTVGPPVEIGHIFEFWKNILKLTIGLMAIHSTSLEGLEGPHIFQGYFCLGFISTIRYLLN